MGPKVEAALRFVELRRPALCDHVPGPTRRGRRGRLRHRDRASGLDRRLSAKDLLDVVLDHGSWQSWDSEPEQPDEIASTYADELRGRPQAGRDGRVGDHRAGHDRGSPGRGHRQRVQVPGRVDRACRVGEARRRRTTGHARGPAAPRRPGVRGHPDAGRDTGLPRHGEDRRAVTAHKAAGLPYLVYLRHPTTGGVFASWGSLGHFTAAEPGALVGFLGPRVFESLYGRPFPPGVQTSENLHARD